MTIGMSGEEYCFASRKKLIKFALRSICRPWYNQTPFFFHSVNERALGNIFVKHGTRTDKRHLYRLPFTPYLSTGDAFRAIEVDNFTIIIQIIEMSTPIRTNCKNINVITLNIIDFLALVLLNDNLVSKPRGSHAFHTLGKRLLYVDLSARAVKIVSSNTNNQIIAKLTSSLQKTNMTIVEHVVRTVCNYFHHGNQALFLQKALR